MGSANMRERMQRIIEAQPDDCTYEEILRELAVSRMVDRGLEDVRARKVIFNADMERRIRTWRK